MDNSIRSMYHTLTFISGVMNDGQNTAVENMEVQGVVIWGLDGQTGNERLLNC
jgi:hypothetical protein